MSVTFLKIASFFRDENTLLSFYVLYTKGEDPFGIFPPTDPGALVWHKDAAPRLELALAENPEGGNHVCNVFNGIGESNYLTPELDFAICAAMYNFYCQTKGEKFEFETFKANYSWQIPSTYTEQEISVAPHKEINWQNINDFFVNNEYKNYIEFVALFDDFLNSNNDLKLLFNETQHILTAEIALRNIGRQHFLVKESYDKEEGIQYMDNSGNWQYRVETQADFCLNFHKQRNLFYLNKYFNLNRYYPISLFTHFEFSDDQRGNYSLKFNAPASQNSLIGSNFSKDFESSEIISVDLKILLRYSQNYLEYIASKSNKDSIGLNLYSLIELITPILPLDNYTEFDHYHYEYLIENKSDLAKFFRKREGAESIFKKNGKEFVYSSFYKHLKEKNMLSHPFIKYCEYLHGLPSTYSDKNDNLPLIFPNSDQNIYTLSFKLFMPFWEIPRIQTYVLEKYISNYNLWLEFKSQHEEENYSMQEQQDWINDGLDDCASGDPYWYWNID
jgi:hypothetical protein